MIICNNVCASFPNASNDELNCVKRNTFYDLLEISKYCTSRALYYKKDVVSFVQEYKFFIKIILYGIYNYLQKNFEIHPENGQLNNHNDKSHTVQNRLVNICDFVLYIPLNRYRPSTYTLY